MAIRDFKGEISASDFVRRNNNGFCEVHGGELFFCAFAGQDVGDFKDTVCPFFESDTSFLEGVFVSLLVVQRFFEARDV